jgi:uncharacterized protein (DUF1499 family)
MRSTFAPKPIAATATWCRRIAIFALAVGVIAVAATRFQIVEVPAGLAVFAAAILLDCIALLLGGTAFVTIWRTGRRGVAITLSGLVIAAVLLALPAWLALQAMRLPVLNDVSTDPRDPPAFSQSREAQAARGGMVHGAIAPGTAAAERAAYPGVQPILVELEADEAYQIALKAAVARGWKIVEKSPPGVGRSGLGHIDAIDRTLIMGFPDDITIRVKPLAGQTRIDVRSASRYGRSDFGANASRIEKYAQELQNQLDTK